MLGKRGEGRFERGHFSRRFPRNLLVDGVILRVARLTTGAMTWTGACYDLIPLQDCKPWAQNLIFKLDPASSPCVPLVTASGFQPTTIIQ